MASASQAPPGSLAGIRVIDLSRYLSGPTTTMLLADLGADVIKVETLPRGDPARQAGPFREQESVYFMASNRNKRSIALNLKDPAGRKLVADLAAGADVLVQNFRPGTVEKMGLGYDELRERNPRLIYCTISGFGAHGAGADLAGFDQSAQAMSGLMSVTGTEATGPLRVGIPLGDSATGVFAAFGIVSALYARERTGTGQRVEASLIESLVSLLSYQAQKYLTLSEVAGQDGNDHPLMFPQGTFATQDTPITLASGNDEMWGRLCAVIGLPDLADDDRFTDNARRMRNRAELRRLMEERLIQRPAAEWLPLINGSGIPAAPIYDIAQALDSEIVRGLGMVATIDHPLIGALEVLGRPVTIGESRDGWLHHPPPLLGEHTIQVLRELGQTTAQIEALVEAGVVR
ncbi:MAG TPA: CoA transferase [Chloroflexota bacterium]|jgi:crotonobetainyl-CoA:carnitine CoA-transferase CaiB-like acyl-CoA transferase